MELKRIDLDVIILISHNLMQLLEAGMPINKALLLISESIENRRYKKCILNINDAINSGLSFGEGLIIHNDRHFPDLYVALISIGERSGNLAKMLKKIISYYTVLNENSKKYKKAKTYPLFLIICSSIVFLFYIIFIIPIMENFILGMEVKVPNSTEKLFRFSHFIHENKFLSALYVGCYVIALLVLLRLAQNSKIYIKAISKFTISKLYYEMIIINCLTLLYSSGISLLKAMELLDNNVEIDLLTFYFHKIRQGIEEGKSLTDSLKELHIISATTLSLVKIGEESGYLGENLERLSKLLIDKFSENMEKIVTLVQPVLFVVIGGIMCFMIITMFGPMISVTQIN